MILSDPSLNMAFRDYGIMLPISPSRAKNILAYVFGHCGPDGGQGGRSGAAVHTLLDIAGALEYLGEDPRRSAISRADLEGVHQREYAAALFGAGPGGTGDLEKALLRAYELIGPDGKPNRYEPERAVKPLTELFNTVLRQVEGSYLACRLALADKPFAGSAGDSAVPGFCYYLGGGMHHARYDQGSGFCLINDVIIAARKIQAEGRARLIWIVDVDAHKGDGSAELVRFMRDRGEPEGNLILTLSVHMASGWPLDGESLAGATENRAPLIPSDIDIPVERGEEDRYTAELEKGLLRLLELSRPGADSGPGPGEVLPDLAIVVDGADPYEGDGLASSAPLNLSLAQCLERDRLIYRFFRERNIPSAWVMAGGYGDRAWEPPAHFLRSLAEQPF